LLLRSAEIKPSFLVIFDMLIGPKRPQNQQKST